MNITQLRAFVAVADLGSFSAAARSLGLSQPAVTMQIQALEADLGATLLVRRPRNSEPTEAGTALLTHARGVLDELDRARDEIERMGDAVSGHLVVEASTTPGQYVLPRLLGAFLERHPDVGVTLTVADSSDVVRSVTDRCVALGMTGARIKTSGVTFEEVGADEIVIVAPPGHSASRAKHAAHLGEYRWVVREHGSGTRTVAEDALAKAGLDPSGLDIVLELGTNEAIVNAVEGGLGIAAVSSWAASKAIELGTVQAVTVGPFPVRRPFFLVIPRGSLSRAADAFVAYLHETLGTETRTS